MTKGNESDVAPPDGCLSRSGRWVTAAFLLLVGSVGGVASFLLFRDGKGWVLLIALIAGALLWALEHLKVRYFDSSAPGWNPLPGYLAPLAILSLSTFAVCLPTLNSFFGGDAFAYIHLFHNPSLAQFLRLFHGDLSQGVWGWNAQGLRLFYGLFYMLSYSLWGLPTPWATT